MRTDGTAPHVPTDSKAPSQVYLMGEAGCSGSARGGCHPIMRWTSSKASAAASACDVMQ